jgi:phosphate transport system protein
MQIRKLVKSGAASHTVALPIDWISKNKLKKGDLIYINEENNNLVISTDTNKKEEAEKEIIIQVDNQNINTLRRKTISAYINNYHLFTFLGNSLNQKLEDIRKILQNFLALEIIEQTTTKLVAKDFLNLKEFSLPNTVRRMDMLTRSIITDAKKGKEEYQALYYRDFEVDKLFFLISRLIRSHLTAQTAGINNIQAHTMWWLAKNLESISDCAKNLSKDFSPDIEEIYNEIEQYYLDCAKAYFKNDKSLADEMIEKRGKLLDKCDKLNNEKKYLLKETVNHSRNIAKIILDTEN